MVILLKRCRSCGSSGCCGDTGQPTTSPIEPLMQNKKRISSFVCARDVKVVDDKARKTLSVPAFSCPICFLYYTSTNSITQTSSTVTTV